MKSGGWDGSADEGSWPGRSDVNQNRVLKEQLYDGLQLTSKGYALLFEGLMRVIEQD
jgi:hypothetical protein